MTNTQTSLETQVPFYRPELTGNEVEEVTATLKSGWLTSGPRVRRFELEFADAVRASRALAVNSCTAALHLAVNALELEPGMVVFVPAMTFAATAAVVRYQGAIPILVDCDPATFNMSLDDAARKLSQLRGDKPPGGAPKGAQAVGMIPVHVGGLMMDMDDVNRFASEHGLWVVEDAAHAFPAACRRERIAAAYRDAFSGVEEIELPVEDNNRIHSWHLFPIRLQLARLTIDRNKFIEELALSGVASSVHWRPLHLHPYYQESFGWLPEDCPMATETWARLVSLPLFPGMREEEIERVIHTVKLLCARYGR